MFTYDESLLGLSTIIAWADGNNETPEVDARVQMIFEEKITDDSIESYKNKYKGLINFDFICKNFCKYFCV